METEYNLVSTDKAAYLLRKPQFNINDSGDKASKLLSQQARQNLSFHLIPEIHSEKGELITNQVEINNTSKPYCRNLYSSEYELHHIHHLAAASVF